MPTWGWIVLVVVLTIIVLPIKLRILKKMMQKRDENNNLDD